MRAKRLIPSHSLRACPIGFGSIPELQQITATEQQAFEAALREMTVIGEYFFQTMDAPAVEMWEEARA